EAECDQLLLFAPQVVAKLCFPFAIQARKAELVNQPVVQWHAGKPEDVRRRGAHREAHRQTIQLITAQPAPAPVSARLFPHDPQLRVIEMRPEKSAELPGAAVLNFTGDQKIISLLRQDAVRRSVRAAFPS